MHKRWYPVCRCGRTRTARRGTGDKSVEIRIGIFDAIERVVIEIGALSGDGYGFARTNAALPRGCRPCSAKPVDTFGASDTSCR
jgi:hypothetical protein